MCSQLVFVLNVGWAGWGLTVTEIGLAILGCVRDPTPQASRLAWLWRRAEDGRDAQDEDAELEHVEQVDEA